MQENANYTDAASRDKTISLQLLVGATERLLYSFARKTISAIASLQKHLPPRPLFRPRKR